MMASTILDLMRNWGSFVGLLFDIVGAFLVYVGVYITSPRAMAIEQIHQVEFIDDLGDPELLRKNVAVDVERARERIRASKWARAGLIFFLIGFTLQAIGAWPK